MTGISAVLDHILGAADTIAYFFWELLRLPLPGADTLIQWGAASFLLVLAVLAVRALLRSRLSCRACYALWALVLIRLLLPFQLSLPLPWSTADLSSAPPDDFWETSVPVFYTGTTPFEDAHPYHQGVEPGYLGPSAGSSGYIHRSDDGTTLSYYWDFYTPAQCLQALWAVGALVTALLLFCSSRPFFRILHSHYKVLSLPECPVPVYEVEGLSSPCLVGPLFPALYLPPEIADSPALPHVLAHELTHLRHGDHLWGFLRCLCLVLHWYDPLVWLAAALSKRDSELACDEGAVARLGEEERLAYGRTLVDMAARRSQCPGSLFRCSTAMAEGRKAIQQRVARLVKGTRPQKAALAAAAALLALAAVLTFGSGTPSPYSYAGYAAAVEGARSIRLAAPPLSSAGYPAIEEEAALEEARSLLLQAEEYDGSGDATAFGFSDVAPYSYQLILPVREDWMYFYLYPFSGGPVYVLPYLDGTASGAVPVATLPSGTIPQLLQLSAQTSSLQT